MSEKEELIKLLIEAGCISFGEFTLKSGATSNIYVNLREESEHRNLHHSLIKAVSTLVPKTPTTCMVGVPDGAVPLACYIAATCDVPHYHVRKEEKKHGKKLSIDGKNYDFVVVEDVVSTGSSIIETIRKMDPSKVKKIIAVVDRESGGKENLAKEYPNIEYESLLKLNDLKSMMNL